MMRPPYGRRSGLRMGGGAGIFTKGPVLRTQDPIRGPSRNFPERSPEQAAADARRGRNEIVVARDVAGRTRNVRRGDITKPGVAQWFQPDYERDRADDDAVDTSIYRGMSIEELDEAAKKAEKESRQAFERPPNVQRKLHAKVRVLRGLYYDLLMESAKRQRQATERDVPGIKQSPGPRRAESSEERIRSKGGVITKDGVKLGGYVITWDTACVLDAVGTMKSGKYRNHSEAIPFVEKDYLAHAKETRRTVSAILELVSHMILAIDKGRYVFMDPDMMNDICFLPLVRGPR